MKVLMVTPYYYPIIGGTESLVENITIKLNEYGVQTDIITFNYDNKGKPIWREKNETINGVKVIRMPVFRLPRPTFFIHHLTTKLKKNLKKYDIIHFHNDTDLSFPLLSYKLNKPKLFHCHCLDTTYYYYRINPIIKKIFINSAEIFIVLSKFLSKPLINLGVHMSNIRILPNGIDIERFKENNEKKIDNLLLFVGRLEPKKGIPTLLTSLNYLKTPVKLVIIGPPSTYEFYSRNIITLLEKRKKKNIHTITYIGKQKLDNLIKWYQKASIFVLPSLSESFPMVSLEALACGTPIVASNVGAIPEIVKDYENGILVPPRNPIKLAEGIQYLLDNEKIRKEFGTNGRKRIVQNYSSEIIAKRPVRIYQELL